MIGTIGFIFGSLSGIIIGYSIGKKKNSIQIGGDNCTQIQIETSELPDRDKIKSLSDENRVKNIKKARKEFFELANEGIKKAAENGSYCWMANIHAECVMLEANFKREELEDYFYSKGYKIKWADDTTCVIEYIYWGE